MSSNGHKKTDLAKRTQLDEATVGDLMPLPPWLQALRDSMAGAIKGDDLQAIMQAQVTKAKEGDMRAASFVFNQAHKLLQSERKQVAITQNNYYGSADGERPDEPAEAEPGTPAKIQKLRARAAAGLPLTSSSDNGYGRPVSDEEEKELRRREAERGRD